MSGVWVGIYYNSNRGEILKQETNATGNIISSFSGTTPVTVNVWARKASSGDTKYKNYSSIQTIASLTGLSLTVPMAEDTNNNATS